MRRRLLMVLVFASVMGLFASWLVYRVTTAANPGANTEKIVVASANMVMAETVTSGRVKLIDWPKGSIPAGALRKVADAEGRVVRSSIMVGEPLLEGKLAPQLSGKGGIMPMLVPRGLRGVTIKVDDAIRESGFILPNSRVDILVSLARERGSQDRIAKVILQDVQVLAAGQTVEMRDNKPVTVTTVTLALTPGQAERLALAQVDGKLMLATRNLGDNQIVQTSGVTTATLLNDSLTTARPERAPVTEARTARPPSSPASPGSASRTSSLASSPPLPQPKVETHTVSVIRAGKASDQVFVRDEDQWLEQKAEQKK